MEKNISIILFFTLLVSCQKETLVLKLLNKEIICKGFSEDSINTFYNYPIFESKNEKYFYTNIVEFQISNNNDKKYIFFIKDLKLSDIYNLDVIIEDENGNLFKKNEPLIDSSFSCKLGGLIEQEFYIQNEKELLLKKIGYNIKNSGANFYNQEVVVSPKENYIFKTSLSLPFVVEDNDENLRKPIYYKLNPKKKYTFRLKYKLKDNIEKIMPKEILSNYYKNNIEIFKGEIETQKIPIVFK